MKLGGMYGLYSNRHTDAGSLVFASVNFARVATPLVFNYLRMVQFNKHAVFNDVLILNRPLIINSFVGFGNCQVRYILHPILSYDAGCFGGV